MRIGRPSTSLNGRWTPKPRAWARTRARGGANASKPPWWTCGTSWREPWRTRETSWRVERRIGKRGGAASLLKAALVYARRGIPVFPCEPGGKRPLTYNGFWDASVDLRLVDAWWGRWPGANLGVPTGERSGLLVLDVDPRDGGPK